MERALQFKSTAGVTNPDRSDKVVRGGGGNSSSSSSYSIADLKLASLSVCNVFGAFGVVAVTP